MFPRRSHVLKPLTELTGKGPFRWDDRHQQAFDEMKSVIAADCINHYADPNKPFDIYTDSSDYQMGAYIMQESNCIAYWSRLLTDAQTNYNTMEKELVAVVTCIKEYHNMLYGAVLIVYTDHKNLTFQTLSQQRVRRWRLWLEDYDVTFQYIEGEKNVLADCFSRLSRMSKPSVGKNEFKGRMIDFHKIKVLTDEDNVFYANEFPELFSICSNEDVVMIECFMNLPPLTEMQCPIELEQIQPTPST